MPKCKDELWHLPSDPAFCSKFLFWTRHTCSYLYSSRATRWESSFCWKNHLGYPFNNVAYPFNYLVFPLNHFYSIILYFHSIAHYFHSIVWFPLNCWIFCVSIQLCISHIHSIMLYLPFNHLIFLQGTAPIAMGGRFNQEPLQRSEVGSDYQNEPDSELSTNGSAL